MASTRLARWPLMEKSSVSIEPETSRAIMMSMPLASTCVKELLNCGRANATTASARVRMSSASENAPARAERGRPSDWRIAVDEYITAGAPPGRPRRHASSAGNSRSNNHQRPAQS